MASYWQRATGSVIVVLLAWWVVSRVMREKAAERLLLVLGRESTHARNKTAAAEEKEVNSLGATKSSSCGGSTCL